MTRYWVKNVDSADGAQDAIDLLKYSGEETGNFFNPNNRIYDPKKKILQFDCDTLPPRITERFKSAVTSSGKQYQIEIVGEKKAERGVENA